MKRKYIIGLVILILLGMIILRLASNKNILDKKKEPGRESIVMIPVKVAVARIQRREISLIKTGTLAPFKEAKALLTTSGTIQLLRFNLGDHVNAGQILAVVDTRSAQLDLQKAENNAAKLSHDLDTYTELLAGQAATQEKVNEIRLDYLDAKSQVSQVKRQISDAAIKAPTAGIISERPLEQGVFANTGTSIATIVNLSQAKVQIDLTESEVYQAKPGQKVKVTTDIYPDVVFSGKVSFISPQADETHNYRVEIMAGNNEKSPLRSGTFVYVDFSRKTTQDVLLIPRDALTQSVKDASVYVLENDVVHQKAIQTGIEINGLIQVVSGLKAGDLVVTSGQINLKDGTRVIISK